MDNNYKVNPWNSISGSNMGYILEQYDKYIANPNDVDESFKDLFDTWGAPQVSAESSVTEGMNPNVVLAKMRKLASCLELADNIRKFGHLAADLNPLKKPKTNELLELSTYNLTETDLKEIPTDFICKNANKQLGDGLDAIEYLKKIYSGTVGFEVEHVDVSEQNWLKSKIESGYMNRNYSTSEKEAILKQLSEAEGFEHFIGKTYVGQKRFSVEGLETLIPLMDEIVKLSAEDGVSDVEISMAHRGRLNVLTHILEKPYEAMLSQFQHSKWVNDDPTLELTEGITGDVKYHLGAVKQKKVGDKTVRVSLANNPSHLEFSGTVVEGYARAFQDDRSEKGYPKQEVNKAVPILIHGDAAISGFFFFFFF